MSFSETTFCDVGAIFLLELCLRFLEVVPSVSDFERRFSRSAKSAGVNI